jgi:hypothetical protein
VPPAGAVVTHLAGAVGIVVGPTYVVPAGQSFWDFGAFFTQLGGMVGTALLPGEYVVPAGQSFRPVGILFAQRPGRLTVPAFTGGM